MAYCDHNIYGLDLRVSPMWLQIMFPILTATLNKHMYIIYVYINV